MVIFQEAKKIGEKPLSGKKDSDKKELKKNLPQPNELTNRNPPSQTKKDAKDGTCECQCNNAVFHGS